MAAGNRLLQPLLRFQLLQRLRCTHRFLVKSSAAIKISDLKGRFVFPSPEKALHALQLAVAPLRRAKQLFLHKRSRIIRKMYSGHCKMQPRQIFGCCQHAFLMAQRTLLISEPVPDAVPFPDTVAHSQFLLRAAEPSVYIAVAMLPDLLLQRILKLQPPLARTAGTQKLQTLVCLQHHPTSRTIRATDLQVILADYFI